MSTLIHQLETLVADRLAAVRQPRYTIRLAKTEQEMREVFRLRFKVFNLELNEGLESSYQDGYDRDEFDAVCEHLVVEDSVTGQIVGTYRLQTGTQAGAHLGYYSEREFDLSPYEPIRSQVLELGRACIHRDHRSFEVLNLLWKGIATHAVHHGARYLIGCSSLTSQDPATGMAMYRSLSPHLVAEELRTVPTAAYAIVDGLPRETRALTPPKLLRAYLAIGAKICGPPAIDREFKTIDFLTLLDLQALPASAKARYLGHRS